SVLNNASCAASSIALPRSALAPVSGTSSATLVGPAAGGLVGPGGGSVGPAEGDCGAPTGAATIRPPPQAVSPSSSAKAMRVEANRRSRQERKFGLRQGCNSRRGP